MSDATIQLLLDKKIPIVTTFAPLVMQSVPEVARQYNIPEWKIAERQKAVADPSRYQGLINAAKAGVVIGFGTDAGSPVVGHDVIAPEMAFMVKLGVKRDNYDAIRSATAVAAQINKLDKKIGTLEPGKAGRRDRRRRQPAGEYRRHRPRADDLCRRQAPVLAQATGETLMQSTPLLKALAGRIVEEDVSIRTKMLETAAGMQDVIALGRGDPDFHTPPHIVEAAKRALDQNQHHYTHPAGLPVLREAIAGVAGRATSACATTPTRSSSPPACRSRSCSACWGW